MPNPLHLSVHLGPMSDSKGKGCNAVINLAAFDDGIDVFLGGVGTTTFSNDPDNPSKSVEETLKSRTVAAEWVSNRFFGKSDRIGDITINFKTINKSDNRSSAVLIAETDSSLFPATIVNTLYFEMEMPKLGLKVFNKNPLVLHSKSVNLSADYIKQDSRYIRDPDGLPAWMKEIVETSAFEGIAAVGKHQLVNPVALYSMANPDDKVGEMRKAVVQVVPHYGLEIRTKESSENNSMFDVEIEIENISDRDRTVQWFADDVNNLEMTSERMGLLELASRSSADPSTGSVKIQARQKDTAKELNAADCILFGASSTGETIEDFASAYACLISEG